MKRTVLSTREDLDKNLILFNFTEKNPEENPNLRDNYKQGIHVRVC